VSYIISSFSPAQQGTVYLSSPFEILEKIRNAVVVVVARGWCAAVLARGWASTTTSSFSLQLRLAPRVQRVLSVRTEEYSFLLLISSSRPFPMSVANTYRNIILQGFVTNAQKMTLASSSTLSNKWFGGLISFKDKLGPPLM
jgi:hypothetical protein